MRLRLLAVMTFGILVIGGPALAGSSASQDTSAEGSSASTGSSSSSASISTGGGGSVGVVQGNVSGGSTAGGSNSSSSNGGSGSSSGGGSSSAATAEAANEGPNAAQDGIVSQLDLPAMGTVEDAIPASGVRSNVIIIGLAAIFAVGLFVLYRKLPRARAAA